MSEDVAGIPTWSASAESEKHLGRSRRRLHFGAEELAYSAVGAAGGSFGGLLGIGGGSAIAPLLLVMGRMRPAQVAGTTLTAVLLVSAVGSGAYASLGHVDLGMALPIAGGSVTGAVLGAISARRLSFMLMAGLFLAILPYFALKEFFPSLASPVIAGTVFALVLLGLVTGFTSGLLGIGGASLVVPSLVGFFLIDHVAAQGVAMTVAFADSAAGAATHARGRNVNYRVLLYLAPAAAAAALGGAIVSHHLSPGVLRLLFGSFVTVIWLIMATSWIRAVIAARSRTGGQRKGDRS